MGSTKPFLTLRRAGDSAAGASVPGGASGLGRPADSVGLVQLGAQRYGGGVTDHTTGSALWRYRPRHSFDHPVSDVSEPGGVSACQRAGRSIDASHPLTPLILNARSWFASRRCCWPSGPWRRGGAAILLLLVWMLYRLAMPILIERMSA